MSDCECNKAIGWLNKLVLENNAVAPILKYLHQETVTISNANMIKAVLDFKLIPTSKPQLQVGFQNSFGWNQVDNWLPLKVIASIRCSKIDDASLSTKNYCNFCKSLICIFFVTNYTKS